MCSCFEEIMLKEEAGMTVEEHLPPGLDRELRQDDGNHIAPLE